MELLKHVEVEPDSVLEIRFRGKGWPGKFTVKTRGEQNSPKEVSYMESWGFLQKYRPFRCHLCPDGTGEFADLSCGDPWYREIPEDEPGQSLVVVRTERGRKILHSAKEAGYVYLKPADSTALVDSQKNLLEKRESHLGKIVGHETVRASDPELIGFRYENWRKSPLEVKLDQPLARQENHYTSLLQNRIPREDILLKWGGRSAARYL
jgi:coenzyme F420 hydrogenase subunit beta